MNKENDCPYFQLDDWGICTYKHDWEDENCENNCLHMDGFDLDKLKDKNFKIVSTEEALKDVEPFFSEDELELILNGE